MARTYSYACRDYPGMEACPAHFTTETQEELMKVVELHASVAHGEDSASWSEEEKSYLRSLFKSE